MVCIVLAMPNTGHQIGFFFFTLAFLSTSTQVIFLLSTLFFMLDSGLGSATIWVAMAIRETLACKKALHLGDIMKKKDTPEARESRC